MIKMSIAIILSMSLVACHNIPNSNEIISKSNNFTKKSFEDDELGWSYEGNWLFGNPDMEQGVDDHIYANPEQTETSSTIISPYKPAVTRELKSGFVSESVVDDFTITTNTGNGWSNQIENSQSGSIAFNNGIPTNLTDYKIGDGLVVTVNGQNSGLPSILENDGISNNQNVLRNLKYYKGASVYDAQSSSTGGWKSKKISPNSNESYHYTFNKDKDSAVTFEFHGTNVWISGLQGPDPGWNDLKVTLIKNTGDGTNYNETDPLNVQQGEVSMLNNINAKKDININGLEYAWYKVRIESKNPSRSTGKISNLFAFDKATVYPSFQYRITTPTLSMRMQKANNMGKSLVLVRDTNLTNFPLIHAESIDLYNPTSEPYDFIMRMSKISSYLVTVEAFSDKNPNSSGNGINMFYYNQIPTVSNQSISANNIVLYFKKSPIFGKVDIYVDDNLYMSEYDLYSTFERFDYLMLENLPSLSTNHKITISPSYKLNKESGKYAINVDAISTKHKATIKFSTIRSGNLRINVPVSDSMGMMKYSLYKDIGNNNWQYLTGQSDLDIFRSQVPVLDNFDTYNEHSFNLTLDSYLKYKLEIEPMYTKNPNSKGYKIGINNVRVSIDGTENTQSIADIICN